MSVQELEAAVTQLPKEELARRTTGEPFKYREVSRRDSGQNRQERVLVEPEPLVLVEERLEEKVRIAHVVEVPVVGVVVVAGEVIDAVAGEPVVVVVRIERQVGGEDRREVGLRCKAIGSRATKSVATQRKPCDFDPCIAKPAGGLISGRPLAAPRRNQRPTSPALDLVNDGFSE